MASEGGDKTEAPTQKKIDEARKQGQVARSTDLNGVVTLGIGLAVLVATGPKIVDACQNLMIQAFASMATPDVVTREGLGALMASGGKAVALSVTPVVAACMVAGIAINVAQVGWKPSAESLKPKPQKLNPLKGAKNIFGPKGMFEGGKSVAKVAFVGGAVALVIFPKLSETAGLVGLPPEQLGGVLVGNVRNLSLYAIGAYLLIAIADVIFQRYQHTKQLKMSKQEVKQEHKDQDVSPELKASLRRRAAEAARNRMMGDVPTADVIVTNPTHFAVALRYDGTTPAPKVVAKGQDLVALKIRKLATEHGVAIVEDKPLARSMYASVEVGKQIPEELFEAVAHVLAYVYRLAGRKHSAA